MIKSAWEDSRDPCRKIGNGKWYTPSLEQMKTLLDLPHKWGKYVMQDGKEKWGCYFGINTQPAKAEQNNYIFLPGAGNIGEDGKWGYVDIAGLYWTNTPVSNNAQEAQYLYFFNGYYVLITAKRLGGMSVRCIRDRF